MGVSIFYTIVGAAIGGLVTFYFTRKKFEKEIKPLIVPIRGGTNGSRLSFMGLPTPNLSNGAHNGHGRYEYIPVSSMEKIVSVIVKISELCAKI